MEILNVLTQIKAAQIAAEEILIKTILSPIWIKNSTKIGSIYSKNGLNQKEVGKMIDWGTVLSYAKS